MKVLTEETLRTQFKEKSIDELVVAKDTLITPSAKEFMDSKKIKLIYRENTILSEEVEETIINKKTPKYISYYSNKVFDDKPEYMTHLNDNILVFKNHNRIKFRGALDSFQSKILLVQHLANQEKKEKLVNDLQEILIISRKILKAEVLNEEINIENILGYNEDEIRKMSHCPQKYFDMEHILPNHKMGYLLLNLNELRTNARELEIVAVDTFKLEDGFIREDILTVMNRLSSCIYIIMYKYLTKKY